MTWTWPRVVTVALTPLTLAILALSTTGQVVSPAGAHVAQVVVAIVVSLFSTALSYVVAWRDPRNALGPVLAWMGMLAACSPLADTYTPAQRREPEILWALPDPVVMLLSPFWAWIYCSLTLLFALYPTGRPMPRWRWVVPAQLIATACVHVVMVIQPSPYDPPFQDAPHLLGTIPQAVSIGIKVLLFPFFMALMLLAAWSLRRRYQSGDEKLRRQVKLLVLTLPLLPMTLLLSWVGRALLGSHAYTGFGIAAMFIAIPLATTVAVLRHDLFDVDRAIAGAAVYGALTIGVVGTYVVGAAVSGAVLGESSAWVAALVTAVMAVLFNPARRWLQRHVDRRLYPQRRRLVDAVADLERRVNDGVGVPEELEQVLRTALRVEDVRVHADHVEVPGIGTQLQHEVDRRSALLLEMIRLRQEATRALEEAQASRARLQEVGYEERRRLERDLHDVAQQRLVALGISMRLAQRRLAHGAGLQPREAASLIEEWVGEVSASTAELRDLAHGIRPSCLDEGLRPALTMLTRRVPIPMDATIEVRAELPDAVSTTAYYVAAEGIANALKHADPGRLELHVSVRVDHLVVRVSDDGRGGAVVDQHRGLGALRDRVAAAGGALNVTSRPGGGTTLEAELPCVS